MKNIKFSDYFFLFFILCIFIVMVWALVWMYQTASDPNTSKEATRNTMELLNNGMWGY